MLYIVDKSGNEFGWHVGNRVPIIDASKIDYIQADGDELEYVRRLFPALTCAGKLVVRFSEEFARLVYMNL